MEAVMAEDVRRFSDQSTVPADPEDTGHWSFESAAEDYPDLRPSDDDRRMFCRSRNESCLSQVREDPQAHTALIDRNRTLLDRIDRLHEHDHLQSEFPYRSFCSSPERERLRADRRELPAPEHQGMLRLACVGNPAGCMMNSLAWSSYGSYRHRLQDYGAKLRVLGTLAWMRRNAGDGRTSSELLAARPNELKSPARDIEFGPDGRTLRVPLYETARGKHWSVPLPPALQPSD